MRVHVVTRDMSSHHILPRLARSLTVGTEWTLGDCPDPSADLNYFFPYLEHARFANFHQTPTAAWFTHLEENEERKASMWHDTAQSVSLRLTSTRLYAKQLSQYGNVAVVTPPLDHEKFKPAASPILTNSQSPFEVAERPRVGTSGFVYQTGRKGEDLIRRLANSELGEQLEGPGYGPLEALACAVPVVVPRGVGIFDELPDVQNLFRYKRGDYDDMERALRAALNEPYNAESLHGITARFTYEAWISDHYRAFEGLLYDVEPIGALPSWDGHAGIWYVAYGDEARECAVRAIHSAKKYMSTTPICLVSDAPLNEGEDVFIQHSDDDIGARSIKTQIYDLSPPTWEYVLYLDADTEIIADISFLFQLLEDGWELAFCLNPAKYVLAREMERTNNKAECRETFALMGGNEHIQLNGGVFAFRRTKQIARMMRHWHEEWNRFGGRDQAALDRALWRHPVRLYTLGNEWNLSLIHI